jgi:murein tripeptide amidase MpaA
MIRRLLIFLFISASITLRSFSQNAGIDDRLLEILQQYGQAEVTLRYTDKKAIDILTRNVSILSVKDKTIYISLSPVTAEWFLMQNYDYLISEKQASKGVISASNINQALEWERYPTYSQYDSIMRSFKTLYPGLCHLDTIGTSINGKLILALKISKNASSDEDEPEVFYSSTIHGDETGGFVLMLRLADYLLKNYQTSSRVKYLVDNLEIWINPLANPDGTYRTGNVINSPTRYNANGVDLNRNFPDPVTPDTKQQKETLEMMTFLGAHRFVLSANFHSGAEVVNYPWDRWLSKIHADNIWFNNISRAYADTVHVYSGPAYMNQLDNGVTRGAVWYIIYGGRQDYVTYGLQGREVTIELDDQTVTPAAQLNLLWQHNWHSFLGYLENALYGIHGQVLNSATSAPVPAKIFITGYDKDSSHVYSDTLSGSFIRYLSPGSWNLTFSAKGFNDTTISNVVVLTGQKTDLIVSMIPILTGIDTTIPTSPVLYPNPSSSELKAVLSDQLTGIVNVRIYATSGKLLSEYDTEAVQGVPLLIDIRGFASGTYSIIFTSKISKVFSRGRFVVVK